MNRPALRHAFERCRFDAQVAHDGVGRVFACRALSGAIGIGLNFLDFVGIPPGCSIGRHRHGPSDSEIYIVVSGSGEMLLDGERFAVEPGAVLINTPQGEHELRNTGTTLLKLVVIDIPVNTRVEESRDEP
ncbi:cupin domain-containing protein [Pseudomonas aeruginosa]|uniref:cupin domain-containing protein n=1 Tax=Pseudomonas aeruginosa TaxID=287 RepID=UPI0031D014DA